MAGFWGDNPTANSTTGIKVGTDSRTGFFLSGEDYDNSLYHGVERITLARPVYSPSGVIIASRWKDVVILSVNGVAITPSATPLTSLGILPTGWRPKHDTPAVITDKQSMKYPYTYVDATNGNIWLTRDNANDYVADGCAIWSTADSTTGSAIITATLNIKGTKKALMRVNPSVQLQSTMQTCTNASGVTGTAYCYKMGNFVFWHSLGFSANISSIVTDQNLFRLPANYYPTEKSFSTGFGAYYNGGDPSKMADWERLRSIADTDGWIKLSTSTKKAVTNCTLAGYHYSNV
jgi:hypothetical protein